MSRDKWHPHAKGYRLWLGNGLYAEIRPVEHATYTKRGKRTSRYWLGGVVAEGIGRSCHACDAYLPGTVDVRGFGRGYETRLLADAKRYAVGEAHAVGWAALDMSERHGARSFASPTLVVASPTRVDVGAACVDLCVCGVPFVAFDLGDGLERCESCGCH